ncbi:helix-turn-helix domain-containing protein [Streptococcus acidominimus]|uniref:HTH DNA-binding protein n=1 Tax=Streptococcus acidominimus TaxID=1326 RepID=A0A1Q8ECW5_STRAI|nr:helix-turn-helix transcriptional regulator [Streptococcus acidominimus]OLF49627.1 transcriptional regulator [Streptococcus acidominimus]SUN08230.1 HTH DNA-binding protein [Streptococcus acidominimus]
MENNFRLLLAQQKKTISDIHRQTGISRTTLVSLYYEKDVDIRFSTLKKIAECLDISINDLVC